MAKFEIGNKAAEKWTEEEAIKLFQMMYDNAQIDNNILSIQDAHLAIPLGGSVFYYLIEKYSVLESYKKDINDVIIARINRGALKGDYNPTAGIWRMKQLGERDEKYLDHTSKGDKLEPPKITFNE